MKTSDLVVTLCDLSDYNFATAVFFIVYTLGVVLEVIVDNETCAISLVVCN